MLNVLCLISGLRFAPPTSHHTGHPTESDPGNPNYLTTATPTAANLSTIATAVPSSNLKIIKFKAAGFILVFHTVGDTVIKMKLRFW